MKKRNKQVTRTGVLMVLSQLLLVLFVAHWLHGQYRQEKTQLQKDISREFTETQRQVLDSLLVIHLIDPLLQGGDMDTSHTRKMVKLSTGGDSTRFNIQVKVDSGHAGGILRRSFSSTIHETISLDNTFREDLEQDKNLINKQGLFIQMKTDTPNAALLQGVRLILNQVGKASGSVTGNFFQGNTALFKRTFYQKLTSNDWNFDTAWVMTGAAKHKKDPMYFQSTVFSDPIGVQLEGYAPFLYRQITPQVLFSVCLVLLTAFAFWQSYAGMKKHIRLGIMKDDLISNLSHELKTPVSTVKVALEALKDARVMENKAVANDYLNMATLEINRLDLLMTKVLNASLLDNRTDIFQVERTDIRQLLMEVLEIMQLRLEQAGAEINLEAKDESVWVMGDRVHIQGVIMNLLDNILKYAGPQPIITINLQQDEQQTILSFADNGPGIPGEYLPRVFDKFFRVPSGNLHNTKGFGLGLSYARQVMQHHKGSIEVANLPLRGCVFTLTFPRPKA